jgi:hypothetical protein
MRTTDDDIDDINDDKAGCRGVAGGGGVTLSDDVLMPIPISTISTLSLPPSVDRLPYYSASNLLWDNRMSSRILGLLFSEFCIGKRRHNRSGR